MPVETFRFAIALTSDAESLDLLRELSSQMARAAGLDDSRARRAGDELVDAIRQRTRAAGPDAGVTVSFERRDEAGPVDVEVTRAAEVRRSWSAT